MRFITVYLVFYFALVIGAIVALWLGGALQYLSTLSMLIAGFIVFALGGLLALVWMWRPSKASH